MEVLVLYVGPPGVRILAEAQMGLLTGGSLAAGEPFTEDPQRLRPSKAGLDAPGWGQKGKGATRVADSSLMWS